MGKYNPLYTYLCGIKNDQIIFDFSEIEKIIGDSLPKSAFNYTAWWSNSIKGGQHPYASYWLDAGFETRDVTSMQADGKVKFVRIVSKNG